MVYTGVTGGRLQPVFCCIAEDEIRLGDRIWRNRGKGEDVQLAYEIPCQEWPVDSQKVGGCDKVTGKGGEKSV